MEYYYKSDGYDFNCGNSTINCQGDVIQYICHKGCDQCVVGGFQYYQINETSYICGGCFRNVNDTKSIEYQCKKRNGQQYYIGMVEKLIYNESNDCSNSTSNITKLMITSYNQTVCDQVYQCHMPS